ncbi:dTDP-4-dehydrorhamnose 3,5-epimerase [Rickettsia endosymbiont of Halotydeus destructor]|uniref:dTDP-4-dehydrorhamnose 3,5-epimerase n=1 Tax=Rickettsia endosymbiont of Halotydeus destructor TaxID=2996754 RepID=UPI003BB1267C
MKYINLSIPEVILLEPTTYKDSRGYFFESFNQQNFEKIVGYKVNFVQDNHSCSNIDVLRGLHYQLPPKAQAKLVRVSKGKIFDVAVDIRKDSPTFGKWVGEYLSAENKKQLWIPEGFAHGFLALSEEIEVLYKTTNYYAPELERCLLWSDDIIGIKWPSPIKEKEFIISEKDKLGINFDNIRVY